MIQKLVQKDKNHTDRMVNDIITLSRIGKDIVAAFQFGSQSIQPVNGKNMYEAIDRTRMAVVGADFQGIVQPTYHHVNINLVGITEKEGHLFGKGIASSGYTNYSLGGSQ